MFEGWISVQGPLHPPSGLGNSRMEISWDVEPLWNIPTGNKLSKHLCVFLALPEQTLSGRLLAYV